MRLSYLRVPTALVLAASNFASSPHIPKALASAVSQSNSLNIKSTVVRVDATQPKTLDEYRKQGDTPTDLNQTFQNLSTMSLNRSNSLPSTLPLVSSSQFKPTLTTLLNHRSPLLIAVRPDCYKSPLPNCGSRWSGREVGIIVTSGTAAAIGTICIGSAGYGCAAAVAIIGSLIGGPLGEDVRREIGEGNCLYVDHTFNRYHRIIDCNSGRLIKRVGWVGSSKQ